MGDEKDKRGKTTWALYIRDEEKYGKWGFLENGGKRGKPKLISDTNTQKGFSYSYL